MLAVIYAKKALDFSVFPTILLIATLLRLTLNIASTRLVLLNGHTGSGAAGQVIKSFGEVVIGGNYTVGLVVFAILVIINFVVITKGGARISEVSARFTLDAMPGKQMAIDSDLAAGIINQEEAKQRRSEVMAEADFYGAMDGAAKFVRGDAIAGLLIMIINLIGGVAIGVADHALTFGEAFNIYAILTIGDGLVAQIPAILLSTSAAVMVTRVSKDADMSKIVFTQLFSNPKPLFICCGLLVVLAVIPGMPHIAFFGLAVVIAALGFIVDKKSKKEAIDETVKDQEKQAQPEERELAWDDVIPIDVISLELGYRLISLVGEPTENKLLGRVRGVRKKLTKDLGFLIPPINIRDNLQLPADNYLIKLMGVKVGEGSVEPNGWLAINPGEVFGEIEGRKVTDPTFGLDAIWITEGQKEYAQSLGYTVVDAITVIATHISHVMQLNAADIFGHEEAQKLLDQLKKTSPKLVEILTAGGGLPHSTIVKVMKKLLKSHIPLIDIRTIATALVEASVKTQDPTMLVEAVRVALKRLIYQEVNGPSDVLEVITLDPKLEQILHQSIQTDQSGESTLALEPSLAEQVFLDVVKATQKRLGIGKNAILVVPPVLRPILETIFQNNVPDLHILSHKEIPDHCQIEVVNVIGEEKTREGV